MMGALVYTVVAIVLLVIVLAMSLKQAWRSSGGAENFSASGGAEGFVPPVPADAPPGLRVFGIGLNKTGTSSLGRFFRAAGFRLYEKPSARGMREAGRSGEAFVEGVVGHYGIFEDWPWPRLYKETANAVPGAKFILTTRASADEWYDSLEKHSRRTGPTDQRLMAYGFKSPSRDNRAAHLEIYERHSRDVAAFFSGRPGRLLVLSTAAPDEEKSAKIAEFLKMPRLGRVPYPTVNRGKPPRGTASAEPPPGWAARAAELLGRPNPPATGLAKTRAELRRYGFVTPVFSKPFGRLAGAAEMRRAIADDTNTRRMPRFVHVPKTGGTSIIHKYVVNNLGHARGVSADVMVCRDPSSRLLSAYRYLKLQKSFWHGRGATYGVHRLAEWCDTHTYPQFVRAVCVSGTLADRHVSPQAEYSPDGVAHLARFESLDADLLALEEAGVLRRSKFPPPPGTRNESAGPKHKAEQRPPPAASLTEAIEAFYADDFARFGYATAGDRGEVYAGVLAAGRARRLLASHDADVSFLAGACPDVLPGVGLAAAKHGRPRALSWLLGHGLSANAADVSGTSLLHLAAYGKHAATAKLLLDRAAASDTLNEWGETPAKIAGPNIRGMIARRGR